MSTSQIITLFIELAQKYDWGKLLKPLPEDEVEILFAIVNVAGFRPVRVRVGYAMSELHDHEGTVKEMSSFQINTFAPYNVTCQDRHRGYQATKWLDKALRFAAGQTDREACIRTIMCEIEKDIKLKDFFEH